MGVVVVVVELVEVLVDELGGVEDVVVGATVEVVVVLVELVVVVALIIAVPNAEISGTKNALLVLYPETVKCTPSSMNRLLDFGVNAVFQSAIARFG